MCFSAHILPDGCLPFEKSVSIPSPSLRLKSLGHETKAKREAGKEGSAQDPSLCCPPQVMGHMGLPLLSHLNSRKGGVSMKLELKVIPNRNLDAGQFRNWSKVILKN